MTEEIDAEISVRELIGTNEYAYSEFYLSMDCLWCEIVKGDFVLKAHEAARRLIKELLNEVEWLQVEIELLNILKKEMR